MKKIQFTNPHRKKHFDFFRAMNHPHFNVTAQVDISQLVTYIKDNDLPFSLTLVYFLSRTANEIQEFRWRIRGEDIVEHESVHPSYTVSTESSDVFSFCTVPYTSEYDKFIHIATDIQQKMWQDPNLEDEEGRDDYLFLSAMPWIRFTSMQHAMQEHPGDCVPRISWGKYYTSENKTWLPVSVQVHHALVDGRHTGAYFELLESMCSSPETWLI
ncbi:MAG: chloramphenicol acetyltransferase [Bacteroidia bacterium]|nr:chloramphenicol acetyltransferase [Bacteroidia bacterium]